MRFFGSAAPSPPPPSRPPFGTFQHVVRVEFAPSVLRAAHIGLLALGAMFVLAYGMAWWVLATVAP